MDVVAHGVTVSTHNEKSPGLSLPYSQKRIYIVEPGVNPFNDIDGINPLALPSSLHEIKFRLPQVPE